MTAGVAAWLVLPSSRAPLAVSHPAGTMLTMETRRQTRDRAEPIRDAAEDPGTRPTGTDAPAAAQQRLPLEPAVTPGGKKQAEQPIPFALTARARRAIAPEALPALRIVPERTRPTRDPRRERFPPEDDPTDTRPARARALRRAGLGAESIARQLHADELLVRAWVGEVAADERDSVTPPVTAPVTTEAAPALRPVGTPVRASAAAVARRRLSTDPGFAAGLGLLAGVVSLDTHAVTLVTARASVAGGALAWLRRELDLDACRPRTVLRLGREVAGDLARSRWAEALEVSPKRVTVTRWHGAPSPDAVEALVRIADPDVATTVAGWCDALLAHVRGDEEGDAASF